MKPCISPNRVAEIACRFSEFKSVNPLPLKVENVCKTYTVKNGSLVHAVKDVSLEIHPGEILGLLGPNGAGKTTVISMITSLESIDQGEIQVFGHSLKTATLKAKQKLGVVPQEIVSHGFFSLKEVLTFHSGYYGIWNNQDRIQFLLKKLGLDSHQNKMVKQLSGGMKRRFMIAKALLHKPGLILLDEPTAGVDIQLRTSMWEFVKELRKEGVAILLTTHYLAEAEELCDRVAIIDKGKIKFQGPTGNIIRELTRKKFEVELKSAYTGADLSGLAKASSGHIISVEMKSNKLFAVVDSQLSLGDFLFHLNLQLADIMDIKTQEGNLEDAFLAVLEGKNKSPQAAL